MRNLFSLTTGSTRNFSISTSAISTSTATALRRTRAVISHFTQAPSYSFISQPGRLALRLPAVSAGVTPSSLRSPRQCSSSAATNMKFPGGCYCGKIRYEIDLDDKEQARTSLCHCRNCKVSELRATGPLKLDIIPGTTTPFIKTPMQQFPWFDFFIAILLSDFSLSGSNGTLLTT